jgi:hypothetical protein
MASGHKNIKYYQQLTLSEPPNVLTLDSIYPKHGSVLIWLSNADPDSGAWKLTKITYLKFILKIFHVPVKIKLWWDKI